MSTIFPLSASVGQEFQGYMFDGTIWNLIGNEYNPTTFSSTEPSNPKPGDLWVDSSVDVATFVLDDYLTIASASGTYATKTELNNIDALPTQSGNNGKFLTTDGSSASWATVDLSSASAAAVAAIVDSAPETLNTLNELAAALGDDANYASTVTIALGNKLDISTASATYATQSYVDSELANIDLSNYLTTSSASSTYLTASSASATPVYKMVTGTTEQRPSPPAAGMFRYNTTEDSPEWYDAYNSSWVKFADPSLHPYSADLLIVAGGGGGGGSSGDAVAGGGGAGAGGYLLLTSQTLTPGVSLAVTIGAGGGGGGRGGVGAQGGNSSIAGYTTAVGGGAGRDADDQNVAVSNGGSGGGASGSAGGGAGSGTAGQGYDGGYKNDGNAGQFAGGGGGSSASAATGRTPGTGASNTMSGTLTTYAVGGYGQGTGNFINANVSGASNTGNGGNGAYNGTNTGGSGGSGIVIVKYLGSQRGTGGTITTAGGYTIHTFTSSGTFTC